ncbi:MAG: hypothetical protein E5299_00731 [Burkholderia gladioli]|nr:MAG: hypothetical protein E5299_00731 [Burkholderia gladioli]
MPSYPHVDARVYTAIRLIQALLGVKTVYRRTLRALQGFTQSSARSGLPELARSGLPELAGAELRHALSPGKNA